MHAAQGALLAAHCHIDLDQIRVESGCLKLLLAPAARKESAFILDLSTPTTNAPLSSVSVNVTGQLQGNF